MNCPETTRHARLHPDFAPTEFMFNDGEAPEAMPAFMLEETARWVAEQEAIAAAAAHRAALAQRARDAALPAAGRVVSACPAPRLAWLGRVESALHHMLPGGFGSLLGLFLCISMSIVLLSAMLPLVRMN